MKDKTLKKDITKINTKNNIYSIINQDISNGKNLYKRLTSAKPNSRSFSNNRPFTAKMNKNQNFTHRIFNINNETFKNIIRNNNNIFSTKGDITSNSQRNYSENKTTNIKKINFRPMTGIKTQINNNVMNININFYNIDMNKRFLIPEINPYYTNYDNISEKLNDLERFTEESIIKNGKNKDNIINNMDLQNYKNSNEFLFEKIIKAIKDINGVNKRLTINDLK